MRRTWSAIGASVAALLLHACGGEDDTVPAPPGGSASPPPAAAPPPPPNFTIARSPFALQQSAPTTYAVYGLTFRARDGAFDITVDPASFDASTSLGVRLVSASELRLAIGGLGEEPMTPNGGGGISAGEITQLGFSALGGAGTLSVLYTTNGVRLASAASLAWSRVARAGTDPFPLDYVTLVYGVPTPAAAVPGAGIVRYGSATAAEAIEVDFTTAIVTGRLSAPDGSLLTIGDARLTPDRTGFTGRISGAAGQVDAPLEGRFVGPGAAEIIYRFAHPAGSGRLAAVGALARGG